MDLQKVIQDSLWSTSLEVRGQVWTCRRSSRIVIEVPVLRSEVRTGTSITILEDLLQVQSWPLTSRLVLQ